MRLAVRLPPQEKSVRTDSPLEGAGFELSVPRQIAKVFRGFVRDDVECPLGSRRRPYRGVGRTGACLAMEGTIDEVARGGGRDPFEVCTENMIRPEQMPYASIGRMHYDTGDYPASVRLCAELLGVPAVRERQRQASQ